MTEQTIFLAALDIRDPAERTAYLDRACGADAALRQQVEALLAAHDRSGLFLDEPALEQLAASPAGERPTLTADPNAPAGPDTPTLTSSGPAAPENGLTFLRPPTRAGSIGRLDRYEILEVLGRGGFGTVLRAFDERLHRVVAVKVLAPQLAANGTARARFNREARSAAAIRDDHVVNVHEVTEPHEPVQYLVMEYVAGQTLQQKLDRSGPLSVAEILRIGSQVARGLAAAHATGHIHRDIKPSNILLENGVERAKLTDFGLARAADDASISHSGVVAGTPMYMAPEQAKGERIDHRADLFSLGSVLYAMCTGRPPFRATTTMAVLKRVCETDPRPIREINPEVPDWLEAIIARLHAKKPEDRFQSAKEVADLLQQHLAHVLQPGEAPMPPRVAVPKPSESDPGRWRRVAIVSAIVLLLYGAFMAGRYMFSDAVKLYMLGMGELQIDGFYSEFDSFIVTSDASPEFVNGFPLPAHVPVFVEPGTYRIKAVGKNHEKVQVWEIKDPREALGVATLQSGEECTLEIKRGQRVSVSVSKWAPPTNPPGGEWVQLFNGKDLTGWKVVPEGRTSWKVENGVLVGHGKPAHLCSERGDFGNFHLRMEARVRRVDKGGALGLFVRTPFGDPGVILSPFGKDSLFRTVVPRLYDDKAPPSDPAPPSYRDQAIGVWGEGIPRDADNASGHTWVHALPDDEWVTHEIIADGGHITVRTNVSTTTPIGSFEAYVALGPKAESKGHIALQLFDDRSVVEIRKIEIKELPPDTPAGVLTALRDAVAAKERSLQAVKVKVEVGAASQLDLTLAQIELTEARVRLAEAEGDRAALVARLQELVAQRQTERDFTEQLIQAGRTAPNVLHDADARLAAARARLSQARPGPPADPQPVKLRSFTPGKDPLPLPQRGPASAVTAVGDAWRIENATNAGNFNVLVAQAIDNLPKDGVLVFRAKVKFEAKERDEARWGELGFGSAKEVYPSWDQWPEVRARYGDYIVDWTEKEARYPAAEVLKKGATVYLYAGLHANGVLWLKDVELLHLPAAPAPPPAVAPLDEKKGKGQ